MFIINDLSNETDRLIDRSSIMIIIIIIISGISRLAITIDRIHIHIQLNQLIDWHGIVGWDLWDTEHISSSSSSIWIKYLNLKWTRRTKCHSGKDIFHSSAEFKIYRVYLVVSFCSIYLFDADNFFLFQLLMGQEYRINWKNMINIGKYWNFLAISSPYKRKQIFFSISLPNWPFILVSFWYGIINKSTANHKIYLKNMKHVVGNYRDWQNPFSINVSIIFRQKKNTSINCWRMTLIIKPTFEYLLLQ